MKKETQGCKYCGYEKTSKRTKKPFDEFIKELKESRGDEFTYVSGYNGASSKAIFRHHMKDGSHHDFKMVPKNLINGTYYCPCCSGYQIYIGYNDFNTRRPELVKYLLNPEEGTKYSEYSNHILEWKCPDCGNILKKRISEVSTRGICCPRCSDGISYPNKFMYNSLLQIKDYLNYIEREFRPDWCKYTYNEKECFGVYDIYFEKDNKKYIVEMDGGLGHGNRTYTKSDKSKDELLDIDKIKDLLAKEHDIEVIRINCDYGSNDRYSFILNEVLNSKLSSILNLSLIDFKKSNILSQQSLLLKTVELWNDGYSVGKISSEIGVFSDTVTHYLKSAQKYGILNMCTDKNKDGSRSDNKEKTINTFRKLDWCFIEDDYDKQLVKTTEAVNEKVRSTAAQQLIVMVQSLPQYNGKNFSNSEFNDSTDGSLSYKRKPRKEIVKLFGSGLSNEDYLYLQDQYDDWCERTQVDSKSQQTYIVRICFKLLDIWKAQKSSKDTTKLDESLNKLMDAANLQPRQNVGNAATDALTFSQLIEKWEQEKPIPEPDPEFKDCDGIGKYIRVWFKGALSHALGLEGGYSKEYEDSLRLANVVFFIYID